MKRHCHIFILLLLGLISCDKQPPMDPGMTNQLIIGDINGVPFKSAITVEMGAYVKKDLCDKDVVALMLTKKNAEDEYQILYLDYLHARPGEYVLTDSSVRHKIESVCSLDSINASLYFQSYPRQDVRTDRYRLLEGPWNYFRILYYDPEKNEIQGQFAAKFVRINKQQRAKAAADTITYTNCKFIVTNIYVQEVFTEPR